MAYFIILSKDSFNQFWTEKKIIEKFHLLKTEKN